MESFLNRATRTAQGLQNYQLGNMQIEQQKTQQQNTAQASDALKKYYSSVQNGQPDYAALNDAILKDSRLASNVLQGIGIQQDEQKKQAASDVSELIPLINDEKQFMTKLAQRANVIAQRGGDPKDTISLAAMYKEDPQAALRSLQSIGAALESQGYKTALSGAQGESSTVSEKDWQTYQGLLKTNPEAAKQFGLKTGFVQTGREESKTEATRDWEQYQKLKTENPEEAEAFGQRAGFISKEGRELSATSSKALIDAVDESESNAVKVTKYIDLADRFKQSDITGGILGSGGSWREAMASIYGGQDEVSKIVSDWQRIRSGEAVASLPPGPATDADIRLALKPLPENANAEYMNKYLAGLSKVAAYKQAYNQAKADFISENGSLRRKDGVNFGKVWTEKRGEVMDSIKSDQRFNPSAESRKAQFLGGQQEPQMTEPLNIGRFKIEVE